MFIGSSVLNAIAYLRGPVARHRLYIDRILRWGQGEPEWRMLDHLVDPARAAIDVGANVGIYTGRLAQLCKKVHAFEPIPWLADDVASKSPTNVVLHRIALSNRTGRAELRVPTRAGVEEHGLTTMEERNPLETRDDIRIVSCAVDRIDNVISEPVGFIKVDVEGHELAVLEGAIETIRANRPVLIIESERAHHPGAPENVFALMRQEGYVGLYLRHGVPHAIEKSQPQGKVTNYIFVPQDEAAA